eukprot:TRINITY_DN2509_c0_g1_i3.p1 TRINITY_DN2509_c0_g1~~TRINITY_DN2509_c0_g1_i3.p1  ORF type:complete len:376 (+),score=-25.11 TRINITY_DN2509_c0_g1_i3:102-1130(+)
MAEETSHPVILHVYDLSQGLARQLSRTLLGEAIDAVYHTAVVVYGTEYWFGGGIERGSPGRTYFGPPMQAIPLGSTEIPRDVFEEFLADVAPSYSAHSYSLLSHNCNNFSDEAAQFLVGRGIPSYILDLPRKVLSSPQGALLAPMLQQLETTLKYSGNPRPPHPMHSAAASAPDPYRPLQMASALPMPAGRPSQPRLNATPQLQVTPSKPIASVVTPGSQQQQQQQHAQAQQQAQRPLTHAHGASAASPSADVATKASTGSAPSLSHRAVAAGAAAAPAQVGQGGKMGGGGVGAAQEQVHAEISREFAALMAAGGLGASEAAAAAVRKVMARHGMNSASVQA